MIYRGYLKLFGDYKKSPKNKFDVKYKFKDYTNDFNMKFSDIVPQKKMEDEKKQKIKMVVQL